MADLMGYLKSLLPCFILTALSLLRLDAHAAIPVQDTSRWELAVRHLDYDRAFALLVEDKETNQADALVGLTEMAYYFAAAGMSERALEALSALRQRQNASQPAIDELYSQATDTSDDSERQDLILDILRITQPVAFERCERRYYPDMVFIQGGTFWMGCGDPSDVSCEPNELPAHRVRLSDFSMSRTEVTVWQYALFCKATGRSMDDFAGPWKWQGNHPMMNIQWFDAAEYCNWLSATRMDRSTPRYRFSGADGKPIDRFLSLDTRSRRHYRLPTEAEWEYAARGGVFEKGYQRYSGTYANQDSALNAVAWWGNNPRMRTKSVQPVALLRPNPLGLFDMTGNAWEWCEDEYTPDSYQIFFRKGVVRNPLQLNANESKTEVVILRGGSWYDYDTNLLRITNRDDYYPYDRLYNIGFRAVFTENR